MSLPAATPPPPTPPAREPLMTPEEVAAFLRVSRSMVYKLRRTGALRCVQVGALYRFAFRDVEAYSSGEVVAAVHALPRRRS